MRHDMERLINEHEAIDGLTVTLIARLQDADKDLPEILRLRAELAAALDDHLSKEDAFLYTHALEAGASPLSIAVDTFENTFAELTQDWAAYLEEWPADTIAADMGYFCDTTLALMTRLRERVAHETMLLYPMALQQGRITLRAA